LKAEADRRDQAIAEARRHRTEIDRPVTFMPKPNGTSSGRARNGTRATHDCRSTLEAVAANKAVLEAHSAELKQADAAVRAAERGRARTWRRRRRDGGREKRLGHAPGRLRVVRRQSSRALRR
jgi:hypothetical protein